MLIELPQQRDRIMIVYEAHCLAGLECPECAENRRMAEATRHSAGVEDMGIVSLLLIGHAGLALVQDGQVRKMDNKCMLMVRRLWVAVKVVVDAYYFERAGRIDQAPVLRAQS